MKNVSNTWNAVSWLFGLTVLAIGAINVCWGNDQEFGIFLLLLSFVYFPPVNTVFTKKSGIIIPLWAKIILGAFIVWAALGVGELLDKIDLMILSL